MPWKTADEMTLRKEFVDLATLPGANVAELCRRYGITRKTAYKWIDRFKRLGAEGLRDQSRRPWRCPHQTSQEMAQRVIALRKVHPTWGARILRALLQNQGVQDVPSTSTVHEILRRHGLVDSERLASGPYQRFERSEPNQLWQMDFKGHYPLHQGRCHPLSVLDDHSRFLIGLTACADEQTGTVRDALDQLFERYGLPHAILCDNGSPWGCSGGADRFTQLEVWLMRLDVKMYHGRAYHPQTQGKVERFHRTLHCDLIAQGGWSDLPQCQRRFDVFRDEYNTIRGHRELGMKTPLSLYRTSSRTKPEQLPPIEYDTGDETKRVQANGTVMWKGRTYLIGKALQGYPIGIRQIAEHHFEVRFSGTLLGRIDHSTPPPVSKYDYLSLLPSPPLLLTQQV